MTPFISPTEVDLASDDSEDHEATIPKKKRRSKNERLSSRKSTLNLQNFEGQNSIKKVDSAKDVEVGAIERD